MLQAETLRGLAFTGTECSPEWSALPTGAEAVPLRGLQAMDWYALSAPPGLPPERVAQLAEAVKVTLAPPTIAAPSSPAELDVFIRAEVARRTALARAAGITLG